MSKQVCQVCEVEVHPLEVFPHSHGIQCLNCYEREQAHKPMPTASEIIALWR